MAQTNLKDIGYALLLVFVLGFLLHIMTPLASEGFENGPARCGVDTPCSGSLKCINGFCAKTDRVPIKEKEKVPLLGAGAPVPYF